MSIDTQGYVTWVEGADAAAFAKAAQAYATTVNGESVNVSPDVSAKATTSTVKFENLKLGYYLVDSTLGALCSLDTTNPNVTIKEKNGTPSLDKEVQEDSNSSWGSTNDADMNQVVNFQATIKVIDGQPKDYVMHDVMSAGLTFDATSVKVTVNGQESTAYTLVQAPTDSCTFEIQFTDPKPNDEIVVTYSATLNSNAVVGLDGNSNKASLSYTDINNVKHNTTWDETKTYTWDMDVLKYTMNNNEKKYLAGVKFVLIKKVPSGDTTKEQVAKFDANKKLTEWVDVRNPVNGKITWPENTTLTTNDQGKIEIDGLDSDTYYLREIETLPGFNMIGDVSVTITGATETEGEDGNKTLTYSTKTIEVENKSGTELPSTGGMGTTIFYILGSVLVLAAGVLLVTKKRMSAEN